MKVYIGPYKNWFGPYQLAQKILFWKNKDDDVVFKLGSFLAYGKTNIDLSEKDFFSKDREPITWLFRFFEKIHSFKKRKIKIEIHDYDIWSMDYTLALIIHPMLIKLKEEKHGAPYVDDSDVPDELKSTNTNETEEERKLRELNGDVDKFWFKRWDYVLNEMIYAFDMTVDGEYQLFGKGFDENSFDRIQNGKRLFGKYYSGLWD